VEICLLFSFPPLYLCLPGCPWAAARCSSSLAGLTPSTSVWVRWETFLHSNAHTARSLWVVVSDSIQQKRPMLTFIQTEWFGCCWPRRAIWAKAPPVAVCSRQIRFWRVPVGLVLTLQPGAASLPGSLKTLSNLQCKTHTANYSRP